MVSPEPPRGTLAADASRLTPLPRSFYARPVLTVARACIGKILVHKTAGGVVAGRIVESEAYRGPEDLAAHSSRGRRTRRTEAMFGPAGRCYMFLLYGVSWAFNLVTGAEDEPHAVLIRGVEPLVGLELMSARRNVEGKRRDLTNGPGKLCQALGLDGSHYGADLCGGELFLAEGKASSVGRSPRIRVEYAGVWAEKPWRFYEKHNRYVSVAPRD